MDTRTANTLETNPESYDTVVIYHGGCPDGLAAAWAFTQVSKYIPDNKRTFGSIYYHYTCERNFYRDTKMPSLNGKDVFIVDYSYSRAELQRMSGIAKSLTVLDHHKTAAAEFATPIDGVNAIFDMTRCGAEIVWDYLYPTIPRVWWMVHIRDRDLWEWKNPNSKAFGAMFNDMGFRFETLDLINQIESIESREQFYRDGENIINFQNKEIESLCKSAQLVEFESYPVYVLNSIRYRSETGNTLAMKPECKFSFVYRYDMYSHEWWISLRGIPENNVDLSAIAKKYGGGGHALASGFSYRGDIRDIIKQRPRAIGFSDNEK